jgi:hypothetical protein
VIYVCHAGSRYAVAMPTGTHKMTVRNEYPEIDRQVDANSDIESGHQRGPSVVATTVTPVDPTRPPGVIGDPCPSDIVVVEPSSVVKRGPSPVVVGHPGIAILCHYPAATGIIRVKIPIYRGDPDRSVLGVGRPVTKRGKRVEKHLERYRNTRLG